MLQLSLPLALHASISSCENFENGLLTPRIVSIRSLLEVLSFFPPYIFILCLRGLWARNTADMAPLMSLFKEGIINKKNEIVLFSATAIALYGYDQGMMSLINTNYDYLETMGIGGEDPLVGIIVSVYYLGCAVGAVFASLLADKAGRKPSIFASLSLTALGNLFMFVSGLGYNRGAMTMMFLGRIIMGLGVGGIDAVIPVYSSELNSEGGRGEALAKEFQSNIFGLNMAFAINLAVTNGLGKDNQWGMCFSSQLECTC